MMRSATFDFISYNNVMALALLVLGLLCLPLAAQNPEEAARQKRSGIAALSAGNVEQAEAALRKACDLSPADEEACYYFARTLHVRGNYEAAREPFDKALR